MMVEFVCWGNICRSPAAEIMLRQFTAQLDLPVSVASSGVGATDGQPIHEMTASALERRGFTSDRHRSVKTTPRRVHEADMLVALDTDVALILRALTFGSREASKVHLLGEYIEPRGTMSVQNPWGHGQAVHDLTVDVIESACRRLTARIAGDLGV